MFRGAIDALKRKLGSNYNLFIDFVVVEQRKMAQMLEQKVKQTIHLSALNFSALKCNKFSKKEFEGRRFWG